MSTKPKRSPKLDVKVLQHHIDAGIRNNSKYCMIAEAIKEAYPQYSHVHADVQTIRMTEIPKGVRYIYLTPQIVQQVLVMFDEGKHFRPFSFKLKGAHTVAAQISRKQAGKLVRSRAKLGRRTVVPNGRSTPDIVGGKAEPRERSKHPGAIAGMHPNARALRHPSAQGIRKFGMHLFTDHDLAVWPPKVMETPLNEKN